MMNLAQESGGKCTFMIPLQELNQMSTTALLAALTFQSLSPAGFLGALSS